MSEQTTEILVLSPDKLTPDQTKINVTRRKKFYRGGGKPKWELDTSTGEKSEIKTKMVERDFGDDTDDILQKHQIAFESGLSVVGFMKKTDRETVVMPDLTADGSVLYGKALHYYISGGDGERRVFQEFDKKFLKLTETEEGAKKIRIAAQIEADKATRAGIRLPLDDPLELVLHPDETWNLVCLDLEQLQLPSGRPETHNDIEARISSNNKAVDSFMLSITNIRNDFQKYW